MCKSYKRCLRKITDITNKKDLLQSSFSPISNFGGIVFPLMLAIMLDIGNYHKNDFQLSLYASLFLSLFLFFMHKKGKKILSLYLLHVISVSNVDVKLWTLSWRMLSRVWVWMKWLFDDSVIPPSSQDLSGFLNVNTESLRDISAGQSLLVHNKTLMLVLGM